MMDGSIVLSSGRLINVCEGKFKEASLQRLSVSDLVALVRSYTALSAKRTLIDALKEAGKVSE